MTAAPCVLLALSVPLTACQRDRASALSSITADRGTPLPSPGDARVRDVSHVANVEAIDQLASLRCARDVRCSGVGGAGRDTRVAHGDNCLHHARRELRATISVTECPAGIDATELDACLDAVRAVRAASCSTLTEGAIDRLPACRRGVLCAKVAMPHR